MWRHYNDEREVKSVQIENMIQDDIYIDDHNISVDYSLSSTYCGK